MGFPPVTVYPNGIDNDYTLFLVYNTTETKICTENAAWADEIEIIPVHADQPEIWADNGFGNISGELFYYDSVSKDENGKVYKLKGCARNLGGTHTQHNNRGAWVRSYVVAEHHNQLVNAILNVENFVGINNDTRSETLDWRIRHLQALNVINDDYPCPDVVFTFNITENDPETGILAYYLVELQQSNSSFINSNSTFRLDFGDGDYTTTQLSGYHRYAVNATIDPVVTITNDLCQLVQTPTERTNPTQPQLPEENYFTIPVPTPPPTTHFTYVPCDVPEQDIYQPAIVFPCISIEGQVGPIPSVIIGPEIIMMSHVLIESNNPVQILYSHVDIDVTNPIEMVSYAIIEIIGSIAITPPIPPTIVIITPSNAAVAMEVSNMPKLEVDWGTPPSMDVNLVMPMQPKTTFRSGDNDFEREFADIFQAEQHVKVEYEPIGIPSEIIIQPPTFPKVQFDDSAFPKTIKVDTTEAVIPSQISVVMDQPIPERLTIEGAKEIPSLIEVVNRGVPNSIELVSRTSIPEKIEVELSSPIPEKIVVETLTPIPEKIILEATGIPDHLHVIGIPDHLEVVGFPDSIPLKMPDNPEIELVWKGGPLELKIDMQEMISRGADGTTPCFTLVPCGK